MGNRVRVFINNYSEYIKDIDPKVVKSLNRLIFERVESKALTPSGKWGDLPIFLNMSNTIFEGVLILGFELSKSEKVFKGRGTFELQAFYNFRYKTLK